MGLWFLSSAHPLINIYVCTKFNFNPFCTFQDMTLTYIHYGNNKCLRGDNTVNIQGRIMVLVHITPSHCHLVYKPSFISITFVFFKIWPGQATIMKNGYGEITL